MQNLHSLPTIASSEAKLIVLPEQRSLSCSIPIACSPAMLYAIWADVAQWHTWDPDTRWARLDGPFQAGSQGKIAPLKGIAVKMLISEASPDRSFTAIGSILGNHMHFRHELQIANDGIVATHHVKFTGWAAGLFMKTVGKDLCKGLPITMTRLKRLCEMREQEAAA
jgi:hypothetical protein